LPVICGLLSGIGLLTLKLGWILSSHRNHTSIFDLNVWFHMLVGI